MSDNRYYVKRRQMAAWHAVLVGGFLVLLAAGGWQLQAGNCYILYFPRSSSFKPSRYFRNSSAVTRSDIFAACFEFFNTISSTKIGQSTRSASASASDGRESMLITSPLRSSQITA